MVLQLKDLFDRAGEKQSFEYDLDLSHLRHGAGHPLVKPVHIIGTVENRTDSPVEIEVVIRMALPMSYNLAGTPLNFTLPYTLSEICPSAETAARRASRCRGSCRQSGGPGTRFQERQ